MRALVWNAVERMDIEETAVPAPESGEVLIRVLAVGICGSEIEGYLGHNSLRVPPLVMGHEFCGIVEDASRTGGRLQAGQKVVVNPLLYCGTCPRCVRGFTQLCDTRRIIGIHRPGAFAERVTVPERAVHVVPDSLSPYRACLAEPLACSLRATRRALARHPLANVLVFGAGGIGLLCASLARLLGAARVIVADTNPARLQIALHAGADGAVNPRDPGWADNVKDACGPQGLDVVLDAAGFQPTREQAVQLVNPGGTVMNIGLGIDGTMLPVNTMIRREIEVLGSFCYSEEDFAQSVRLLSDGRITETGWTQVRPLEEGGAAFAELVAGKVHYGKIILSVGEEERR